MAALERRMGRRSGEQRCCIYGRSAKGRHRTGATEPCCPHWQAHLPCYWQARVVAPQSFRVHRELEMPARRIFGFDASLVICFYAYDYRLIEPRLDDDTGLYPALVYGESLSSWRLLDGRWLVHRRLEPFGEDDEVAEGLGIERACPR